MKTFTLGGIHPPQHKDTPADAVILVVPRRVTIPLSQHIGVPSKPLVKRGDSVVRGQLIGEGVGAISAHVHASISGTVKSIEAIRLATGHYAEAFIIEASDVEHDADMAAIRSTPEPRNCDNLSKQEIIAAVLKAGVVGMGGATFPSPVKLTPPKGYKADFLILNGAECEPYLTCDDALMRAKAPEIIAGARLLMRASGAPRTLIGIEDNKPRAIAAMSAAAAGFENITVVPLKSRYPQGGEKQLIEALTGRRVPSGGLPIHIGAIVHNVATVFSVYQAVALGKPLIDRLVTIAGVANFLVPIGTNYCDLPVEMPPVEEADVVTGGPMMGRSVVNLDAPVTKGASGIVVLPPLAYDPKPCIRCGMCVDACPMGLEPYLIAAYSRHDRFDDAREAGYPDCIECGCCTYVCPSHRPILDYIRLAKRKR